MPVADRIVVRVDKAPGKTAGGLFLGSETKAERTGVVVSAAPGRLSPQGVVEPIGVAEGDHVMWKDEYGAQKVDGAADGEQLIVLRAFSIVAKW